MVFLSVLSSRSSSWRDWSLGFEKGAVEKAGVPALVRSPQERQTPVVAALSSAPCHMDASAAVAALPPSLRGHCGLLEHREAFKYFLRCKNDCFPPPPPPKYFHGVQMIFFNSNPVQALQSGAILLFPIDSIVMSDLPFLDCNQASDCVSLG